MILRPYQVEAVEAVYTHLRTREDNPCVVLPTAAGKTPCIAQICRDAVQRWSGRVVVLAHVKELLEQAGEKLQGLAPDLPVGVYSAGLKRKDLGYAVTVAGIQSAYKRADRIGSCNLIIVDEAHLIPPDGEGMYRTFLADMRKINPSARTIGFTATPYRMKSGSICAPDNILHHICYEAGVRELIVQGYLCPVRSKAGLKVGDWSILSVRAGEYVAGEVEKMMDADDLVSSACAEIAVYAKDRQSTLIFCAGVQHARHVAETLGRAHNMECGVITGETPATERNRLISRFRNMQLRCLANVNVLTTGFDAPNIDCVALLRPTLSPGLYYQMVGRGFRLHPGKSDCLVLDFGGNVLRHGPVDAIRSDTLAGRAGGAGEAPAKECPECRALCAAGFARCPECGHEFPPPKRSQHDPTASSEGVLSGQVSHETYRVLETTWHVHQKRDAPPEHPKTMRVEYRIGFNEWQREWVCFEHQGYARRKAEQWWRARSEAPLPRTSQEAVDMADDGALAETIEIVIKKVAGEKYDSVVDHTLGAIPKWVDPSASYLESDNGDMATVATPQGCEIPDDEIPF